jgi:hypothetical protein
VKIGFTGTRKGMTLAQWTTVQRFMHDLFEWGQVNEFHSGDCIGADTQAYGSANELKKNQKYDIVQHGHPCNMPKMRSYEEFDREHPIKPPLVRNRDIVNESDVMIAAPHEYEEVIRGSGTWATIRYARLQLKRLIIVWPDGTSTEERLDIKTLLG